MVKLEEVEDAAFLEKPETSRNNALFQEEDDDDFTDTDSEISSITGDDDLDESLYDRLAALKDIVPPQQRASLSKFASNTSSAVSTGISYGGKGLWVIISSVLLLGIPYALALSEEQALMEAERQQSMMQDGAQGLMAAGGEVEGSGQAKPAL
ncbi:Mitochondrial import receptor subunit tom22 [Cyphellophora attinorum]|uniref:Mitochondrial import receptor subunit tom22 n=1 Tax=Cyphellophora attinorum TaxID=1664694 RepID=A0A0N0NHZ7_9EURO|nr:Mitochondrial import receptor subunit tom22 [Phialophora attinorum]KPI35138.1 Mitochondrial import receptor subunit tom22 [Phialophora attinorum]